MVLVLSGSFLPEVKDPKVEITAGSKALDIMMGFHFTSLRALDRTDGTVVLQQGTVMLVFVRLNAELIRRLQLGMVKVHQ